MSAAVSLGSRLIEYLENELEADAERDAIQTLEQDQESSQIAVTLEDFRAYMPEHKYIFTPSREVWPASSVDARVTPWPTDSVGSPMRPSAWLDQHRPVEQMTWAPGEPMVITDRLVSDGGWIERPGCNTFNLYKPPTLKHGDASAATPWLKHVHKVFPESATHIIRWLAHRVQRPAEKINHSLMLGGDPGVGKDTILEPIKHAIGPWNFSEVTPKQMTGRFNGYVKSVILRISETRDLGDFDRYAFYESMKVYAAAPPDVIRCDEKNIREHAVFNVIGVAMTSNHKTDGIFLPADDRRHYVAWSHLKITAFSEEYWKTIYNWYQNGGAGHVAAYLSQFDLRDFDPKAPPPKTTAFWEIVDANRSPEDAELADLIDVLGNPPPAAITVTDLLSVCVSEEFRGWLKDRRNSRQIPHRLEAVGYVAVRNDADKRDGHWKVDGKRQVIYTKKELSLRDRIIAAQTRCHRER